MSDTHVANSTILGSARTEYRLDYCKAIEMHTLAQCFETTHTYHVDYITQRGAATTLQSYLHTLAAHGLLPFQLHLIGRHLCTFDISFSLASKPHASNMS